MSHFQVSQDLDESLTSLSRLGWVTFKSLETWMSHFQVSRDLDKSLSSLSRLEWGLERRGTGSLSSSVDCCSPNLLDLLRVKTRVCSYNWYATPFLIFPSHLTSVKFIKLKRTQSVFTREKEREKERKNREKIKFFIVFLEKKWTLTKK